MSIRFGAALFAALAIGSVAAQDTSTEKGKLSYAIGFEIGSDFVDKKMDVDVNTVIRGIQDGVAKRQPTVPPEQMRAALDKMREKLMAEAKTKYEQMARENKAKSDKFMAENKVKKGIITLPSGIQYRVIEEGIGKRPLKNSEVTVHYRGSLTSGLEFDSSFARGVPATFKVDAVLKGWQDILPMMKVGDHWQLFLPPEQAYGMRGQGPIGPNEALVFEIKLVDVK
ncbi:MAG: FKBP-type peptidyl-prolyl cis-trans isomerase [Rhodanobacteraceae bacterium]|nr:FKBP-type peptidyl-prolyl cis-trans isomerase [Rhodanobacteraceae bacterium]